MARKVKLDLGCGPNPRKGFVGVDLYCGPQHVDLTAFPWPWADESVDEVWCSHFVEHLPRPMWCQFVDELHRILRPGATAVIVHPHLQSVRAFQDPTHLDFIPAERWAYTSRQWRQANGLDHPPYPSCDFDFDVAASFDPAAIQGRSDDAIVQMTRGMWNVAVDLQVTLTKKG